jgi:hypothetical protein
MTRICQHAGAAVEALDDDGFDSGDEFGDDEFGDDELD